MSEEKSNFTLSNTVPWIIGFGTLYVLGRTLDRELARINEMNDSLEIHAENESDAHTIVQNREGRRSELFHNKSSEAKPYYQKFNHSKLE